MAMQIENTYYSISTTTRDTLYAFSGAALMMLGAGLILANPKVRKYVSQLDSRTLRLAAVPQLQRYLKPRQL